MANKEGVILTRKGLQLIAKLSAKAGDLQILAVKVGTGILPEGTDILPMTDIISYKMDGIIADCWYNKNGEDGYVVMQLDNAEVESGFVMTEIGLYATDPDLGEILYAYIDMSDDPNYIMPATYSAAESDNVPVGPIRHKMVQMKLHILVGGAKSLSVVINPAAQITREVFDREIDKIVTPDFDDSGEVEGITSFGDFLESFVKGTSIYQIFTNLKAGLKYVLHVGQLVNNCVTDNAELPLAAAQGKVLQDQITGLYSEIQAGVLTYNPDTGYFGMQYAGAWNDILFAGLEAYWLYNKGNEFTARTGGWSDSKNITGNKMTKYNDHINLLAVPGNASSISMGNATLIDFSNFDRLYIDMECISENPYLTYFVTLFSQEGVTINLKVSNDGPISRRIIAYDIAQYNSKYIIYIQARNTWNIEKNCNVNVYSVRLA